MIEAMLTYIYILCRSHDGRLLVLSSTDGYCTMISFDVGELGTEYKLQVPEVLVEAAVDNDESDLNKPVNFHFV